MDHSFNTDIAIKFGVHEAVFIHNMFFWIEKNRANNKHFYENNYWTYNSLTALEKLFPYLTRSQIRTTINNCVNSGAVIRGVFNKEGYDKTAWFSLSDDITCLYTGCAKIDTGCAKTDTTCAKIDTTCAKIDTTCAKIDTTCAKIDTTCAKNRTTIPYNKPYSKPYSKPYIEKEDKSSKNKKFEKPTIAEIENYCKEINSNINAHNFYDFYESKGWLIGKNPMKCWKACVRTWERNTKGVKSDAGFTSNKLVTEVDSRENATRNKATVDKWGIETNRL